MKKLDYSELENITGGNGWEAAGCIASVLLWGAGIAALTTVTAGTGTAALLALAGFHIIDDISMGLTCAMWISGE